MGGSESKATVLECMIKNLKKEFGGEGGGGEEQPHVQSAVASRVQEKMTISSHYL